MPAKVILDEGRYEEETVIVAIAPTQLQRLPGSRANPLEPLDRQLVGEPRIVLALVDQDLWGSGSILDQGAGVERSPCRFI